MASFWVYWRFYILSFIHDFFFYNREIHSVPSFLDHSRQTLDLRNPLFLFCQSSCIHYLEPDTKWLSSQQRWLQNSGGINGWGLLSPLSSTIEYLPIEVQIHIWWLEIRDSSIKTLNVQMWAEIWAKCLSQNVLGSKCFLWLLSEELAGI